MQEQEQKQKQSTAGIRWWSPTQLLTSRHMVLSTTERTGSPVFHVLWSIVVEEGLVLIIFSRKREGG
jgi:hypothetical protein